MATPRLTFLYPFLLKPAKPGSGKTLSDQAAAFQQRRSRAFHLNAVETVNLTSPVSLSQGISNIARSSKSTFTPGPSSTTTAIHNPVANPRNSSTTGPRPQQPSAASRSRSPPRAGFRTSVKRRRPTTVTQRYGSANEPPPHLIPPSRQLPYQEATPSQRKLPEPASTRAPSTTTSQTPSNPQISTANVATTGKDPAATLKESALPSSPSIANPSPTTTSAQNETALNAILRMEVDDNVNKPPHLTPPPYIHHFDTFTVVRSLQDGGFTEDQAVSITKLMRLILADNMDIARDGILSKADQEMSAYLFRAASSELRTELTNNRTTINDRMRTERSTLQHEVDVLSARITADISSLKDELKGMFDDRKMTVRMERRDLENRIQELNYRITTRLQSEMRSEVEGLRWVLVRRTAIAIASVVITAFITLRASKYAASKAEEERKSAERAKKAGAGMMGVVEGGGGAGVKGLAAGDDVNPELVTLG